MDAETCCLSLDGDTGDDYSISNYIHLLVACDTGALVSPLILQRCAILFDAHAGHDQIDDISTEKDEIEHFRARNMYMLRRNTRAARGAVSII